MDNTRGIYINCSNASQTNYDDDNYHSELFTGKRKLDEKVTIFKRATPVRKIIEICEIDCNNYTDVNQDIGGQPTHSLTCSSNEPKDDIDLGNRKVFVFKEDENAVKRNGSNLGNTSDMYIEITPMTIQNEVPFVIGQSTHIAARNNTIPNASMMNISLPGPSGKVGIPKLPIPNIRIANNNAAATNNTIISMNNPATATSISNVMLIPAVNMEGVQVMLPIVMPQVNTPGVSGVPMVPPNVQKAQVAQPNINRVLLNPCSMPNVPITKLQPGFSTKDVHNNDTSNIVISEVFSLNKSIDSAAFNKFFEWKDRTTDRRMGPKFDKDYNLFCLHLHAINSRAYRLLMNTWRLSKETTLKNVNLKIGPKLDNQMAKLLSRKFASLSNEAKHCTLGLYATELKPFLHYDPENDLLVGAHNVNGVTSKLAAKHALIAMVRGLKVPWHQLVAFSLLSTMDDVDSIEKFVNNLYMSLKRMGLKIKGVVMSDDSFFWNYCRAKHYVSPSKIYLHINKETVYTLCDIPHIVNNFKDDFMTHDFVCNDKTVSWRYVKQAYDLDKERGKPLLSDLSESDFQIGRKDLNICKVFSGSVSKAIQFYIDEGLIDEDAAATADFIRKLHEIFDVLNSNKLPKMPSDAKKTIEVQMKTRVNVLFRTLDIGSTLFKKLKVYGDPNKELDSVKYLVVSMKALYLISVTLKEANLTGLCNAKLTYLDPIQDFMKSLKDEAKTDRITAIQLTRAFSKRFVKGLVELIPAPKSIDNMDNFLKMADSLKECYKEYDGKRVYVKTTDYRFKLPNKFAIIYVSSYLICKCWEKHKCEDFAEFITGLQDLNKMKIYAHFERYNKGALFYDKLKLPSMSFVSYIERLDNMFTDKFKDAYYANLAETILISLKSVPKWGYPCPCFPKSYLLKLFVRMRIYHTVFSNTKCWKNRSSNQLSVKVQKLC